MRSESQNFDVGNIFTQFHAWWHILAGTGTYLQLQLTIYARYLNRASSCTVKVGWFLKCLWSCIYTGILSHTIFHWGPSIKMSEQNGEKLTTPPLSVKCPHWFDSLFRADTRIFLHKNGKIWIFCTKKCGRPNLKTPSFFSAKCPHYIARKWPLPHFRKKW